MEALYFLLSLIILSSVFTESFGNQGTNWTIETSVPALTGNPWREIPDPICFENFGEKEAQVLCRSLGYTGVESVSSIDYYDFYNAVGNEEFDLYPFKLECQGSEAMLEECQEINNNNYRKGYPVMGCPNTRLLATVRCAGLRCKGKDSDCCTTENPCKEGDGDCDKNEQCEGSLKCGNNNCPWGDGDDCCHICTGSWWCCEMGWC